MAMQSVPDSPQSHSKTFNLSKDHNVHSLTPKQQAIHHQTIQRHLSAKALPAPSLQPFSKSNPNKIKTNTITNKSIPIIQDNKFNNEPESKSYEPSSKETPIRKNRSTPSLSQLQQQKVETQLYLHPTQIPRSLSATFADYKPHSTLSFLMDLPTEAYMGINNNDTIKTMLQHALKHEYNELNSSSDEAEDLRIDSSCARSQVIPTAPYAIPTSVAIAEDLSDIKLVKNSHELPAPPSPPTNNQNNQYFDQRVHAESIKNDIEQALKQGYTVNLCIAVLQALIGAFLYGWNIAILNVPQSVVKDDETNMSDTEYALLATMFCAGGLIGALFAGPLQDKIGRKRALLWVDIIFILSAALTYFYAIGWFCSIDKFEGYIVFWLGRFMVGIACGAATAIVPTYLGEIAPPLIRGAIGTSNQLTICFGVVMVELLGYKSFLGGGDTWQYLFIGNAVPIVQLLTAWTFPESPKWLVQKGRDSQARSALRRLRMTNDVRVDMMLMKGGVLHEQNEFYSPHISPGKRVRGKGKNKGITDPLLSDQIVNQEQPHVVTHVSLNQPVSVGKFGMTLEMWKAVKWATIIAIVLMFMQQFSGINAVFYYSSTILNNAGIDSDEAVWLGSLGISVANFFAVFIAVFSIDRAGRKLLLILSCIVMASASVLVSIAIMLESDGTFWQYSSIAFLVLFVIGFEIGLGAIPWLMMAELAPMKYRGVIVAIATASNWGSNLLIAQFSGPIIKLFYFYPFALVCLLGIIFTVKFIPETNGKTAAEIQKELQNL